MIVLLIVSLATSIVLLIVVGVGWLWEASRRQDVRQIVHRLTYEGHRGNWNSVIGKVLWKAFRIRMSDDRGPAYIWFVMRVIRVSDYISNAEVRAFVDHNLIRTRETPSGSDEPANA